MIFCSEVVFDYNIKKGNLSQKGQLPTNKMYRLFDIVRNSLNTDSFELILNRTMQLTKYTGQEPTTMDIDKETLKVIVADKLTYPYEVRKFLTQKYNDTFNFDELKLPANTPVYFGGVMEIEELGPINPNTGDKTTYTRRYVECRTLNDKDIVVDKNNNLHQIWPTRKDEMPFKLLDFLSKVKERVY